VSPELLPPSKYSSADPPFGPFLLGKGSQGHVTLDPGLGLVTKHFRYPGSDLAAGLALSEYTSLESVTPLLANLPYLTCPNPERVDSEHGTVVMTYVPGYRLETLLMDNFDSAIDVRLDHIADHIALFLEKYVTHFGRPFFPLSFVNILYQPDSGVVGFIDLNNYGSSDFAQFDGRREPMSVTLGKFFGRTILHSVETPYVSNRLYWQRKRQLLVRVLARLIDRDDLSIPLLHRISTHAFVADVAMKSRAGRLWYSSMGRLLFSHRLHSVINEAVDSKGSGDA
jgi:hypothetical protein